VPREVPVLREHKALMALKVHKGSKAQLEQRVPKVRRASKEIMAPRVHKVSQELKGSRAQPASVALKVHKDFKVRQELQEHKVHKGSKAIKVHKGRLEMAFQFLEALVRCWSKTLELVTILFGRTLALQMSPSSLEVKHDPRRHLLCGLAVQRNQAICRLVMYG
jgi:hypothetical protein